MATKRKPQGTMIKISGPGTAEILDALTRGGQLFKSDSKPLALGGTSFIDIVFDRMPDENGACFIEVENDRGESISVGEWIERPNGQAVLRIKTDSKE